MTGVTERLFMCQMFMCLFRPLLKLCGASKLSSEDPANQRPCFRSAAWKLFSVLFLCVSEGHHTLLARTLTGDQVFPKPREVNQNSFRHPQQVPPGTLSEVLSKPLSECHFPLRALGLVTLVAHNRVAPGTSYKLLWHQPGNPNTKMADAQLVCEKMGAFPNAGCFP